MIHAIQECIEIESFRRVALNYTDLSTELSYRHHPQKNGVILDDKGWTDLFLLISRLQTDSRYTGLTEADIWVMIGSSEKRRHEVKDGKIRAVYGHSTVQTFI